MNFFNIDLHISIIADMKKIFSDLENIENRLKVEKNF